MGRVSDKMEDLPQNQLIFSFSGTQALESVLVIDLLRDLAYRVTKKQETEISRYSGRTWNVRMEMDENSTRWR